MPFIGAIGAGPPVRHAKGMISDLKQITSVGSSLSFRDMLPKGSDGRNQGGMRPMLLSRGGTSVEQQQWGKRKGSQPNSHCLAPPVFSLIPSSIGQCLPLIGCFLPLVPVLWLLSFPLPGMPSLPYC